MTLVWTDPIEVPQDQTMGSSAKAWAIFVESVISISRMRSRFVSCGEYDLFARTSHHALHDASIPV